MRELSYRTDTLSGITNAAGDPVNGITIAPEAKLKAE